MSCNDSVIDWLLDDSNPAVAFRIQTELLQRTADRAPVAAWVSTLLPRDWQQTRGQWYRCHLTAVAECGLRQRNREVEQGRSGCALLTAEYDSSCADFAGEVNDQTWVSRRCRVTARAGRHGNTPTS